MRTGQNPKKKQGKIKLSTNHRVVLVAFIPKPEGYYAKVLDVFKLCLDSLIKTNKDSYKITVVDNGSCQELKDILRNYTSKEIDCIIKHSTNIGKIDALIGAARSSREDYITLSDADILFMEHWDKEIMKVFKSFKKVGSVSPIPFRHGLFYGTSSALMQILFNRLNFQFVAIPENFEDHNRYLASINWNNEKDSKIKWPVIEKNGVKAIVGSGHQVLTIKRDMLFSNVPKEPSLTLVGGDSEYKYIDEPIDKAGLMRLSVYKNKAYHMGNEVESWMLEKSKENKQDFFYPESDSISQNLKLKNHTGLATKYRQKTYTFRKAVFKKMFRLFYNN